MKYILMMNCPKTGYETFGAWPKKDLQAHIGFMVSFNKALSESGELVSAEGLAAPDQAKSVRAGKDGARHATPHDHARAEADSAPFQWNVRDGVQHQERRDLGIARGAPDALAFLMNDLQPRLDAGR